MNKILPILVTSVMSVCFWVRGAETLDELQQRMHARLPKLAALKQQQTVGETWNGLVAVVPQAAATKEATALVTAENADRRELYKRIAAKLNITPDKVARKRAESIRDKAKPGLMVQAADGSWHEHR
jgi:uncharacterized protein YdbL (DUF1318 family)